MNNKKISVCLATYNGEKYIKTQIKSILDQLSPNDELIISDDSSTDNTIDIIQSLNDSRIRLYLNNKFHSPIRNFENALKNATGDIIFLSDQDDKWLPNKITIMQQELENNILVVSDAYITNSKLNYNTQNTLFNRRKLNYGFFWNLLKSPYTGCCMAFRKALLVYCLPFPKSIAMHNLWLGLTANLVGNVKYIEKPLILYRRHEKNCSFSGETSKYPLLYRIKYRFFILCLVFFSFSQKYYKLNSLKY